MFKNKRLVYLWCLLICGIFLISILRGSSSSYDLIATFDSSRWVHFLIYASIAAIPVAAWRYRRDVAFCLVTVIVSVALELLQAHTPRLNAQTHNISADMFGIAAGILLGLNLRLMKNSAKSLEHGGSGPNGSALL